MKLLEFNYSIEYKKSIENRVAYAISATQPTWISDAEDNYTNDSHYTKLIQ
jgi:hypothetical protein